MLYTEPEQPDHQNPEPYEEPEILSPDDFFEVEDDDDEAIQQAFKQMSSQCDDDLQKGFCIETPEEEQLYAITARTHNQSQESAGSSKSSNPDLTMSSEEKPSPAKSPKTESPKAPLV